MRDWLSEKYNWFTIGELVEMLMQLAPRIAEIKD